MSQRIEQLVLEFVGAGGGYKAAIRLAGRMNAVAQATKSDDYWTEQVDRGWSLEFNKIADFDAIDPRDDVWFDMIKQVEIPDEEPLCNERAQINETSLQSRNNPSNVKDR